MPTHVYNNGIPATRKPPEFQLAVVMRVKNEERILERGLESLRPLGCRVVLLDDGSTDHTPAIAQSFDFVKYIRQDCDEMDEGRDRTRLLREALALSPEWIFTLDGDEVLPVRTVAMMHDLLNGVPEDINILRFALAFMWGEDQYVDIPWRPFEHQRAFRVAHMAYQDATFSSPRQFSLHCGCVPQMKEPSSLCANAFIKAYGYDNVEAYQRKLLFYTQHDITLDTHRQIVERLRYPLAPWDDYKTAPEEWGTKRKYDYLSRVIEEELPKRNGSQAQVR